MIQLKGLECDLLKLPAPESICDGYVWTGPVNRQTITIHPGVVLELTQFFGGVKEASDEEEYKLCRHEYRLLAPTNRLFFVHYLAFNAEGRCKPRPADAMANPSVASPAPFPPMPGMRPPMPPAHQMPQMRTPMPQTMKGQQMPPAPVPPSQLPKKPSAPAQDDSQGCLSMDESEGVGPHQRVDLAYNRLRFQKQLLARLFCKSTHIPSLDVEETNLGTELPELANAQIDVLKTEIERLQQVKDWLGHNVRDRRLQMNQCFAQLAEAEDETQLDLLMAQWDEIK